MNYIVSSGALNSTHSLSLYLVATAWNFSSMFYLFSGNGSFQFSVTCPSHSWPSILAIYRSSRFSMLMLFRTGQQVVHHASHWQTVHWTFWLHLLHKHTLSFFRVRAAYFQWYRPLKWRSQSLSFICCRSEHKLMTSPVALSLGSSAKSDSDAFSPTSRASRVIVRISRLLQRSASSNASIQHFPERTRNSSNNSPSNISPFFLEFSTSHDITRDITTFQRLERPASSSRICAVTRSFQTTTRDLSVFPFLSR